MVEHPGAKADRRDFKPLLPRAYRNAFQTKTLCHSFAKSGLFASGEAIAPSVVAERKEGTK